MNRTDRLYALVEELRAAAPRTVTARRLAERYEVSVRTIERDLLALQEAGVPIWTDRGRRGGYGLDAEATMPPVNLTPAEATAIALALRAAGDSPLALDGRSALTKILNAMSPAGREGADELAGRIHLCDPVARTDETLRQLGRAISDRRVVELDYVDRHGCTTERRRLEPEQLVRVDGRWYVHGWCRRREARRTFRAGRIVRAVVLRERAPDRGEPSLPVALGRGRLALAGG